MLGFLRWQFSGWLTSVQFWALAIAILGVIARIGGCPGNIPFYITMTGVAVSFIDACVWVVHWQYRLYQLEQKQIVEKLSRK